MTPTRARPDEEAVREAAVPVDVVRLTPLRAGTPQHAAAAVLTLDEPATLSLLNLYRLPPIGTHPVIRSPELRRVIAGLIAREDHPSGPVLDDVDRLLDQHHTHGVAVETWGTFYATGQPSREAPHWWYVCMPRVNRLPLGVEDWPIEEPGHVTAHAAGEVHPNPAHTFAHPRPYPGPVRPLDAGTYHRQAATPTPPPKGHQP